MKRTPKEQMLLPEVKKKHIPCGHTLVGWNTVIVYVRGMDKRHSPPTHMHFSFFCQGEAYAHEVVRLVNQWTWYPGNKCYHRYEVGSHGYNRARKEAIKAVETYRRNYLKKHGQPPDTLFNNAEEFTRDQIKKATDKVNYSKDRHGKNNFTGWQESFDFGDP